MGSIANIKVRPIGIVENGLSPRGPGRARKSRYHVTSRIKIYGNYAAGLAGLDGYSHIIVIWRMHEGNAIKLRVTPWGRADMPDVGIFATRFPARPNRIGISLVQLIKVSRNSLTVRGLDAWSGSPVLDIKPYDYYDIVKSPRVPEWFRKCWEEHSEKREAANVKWLGP